MKRSGPKRWKAMTSRTNLPPPWIVGEFTLGRQWPSGLNVRVIGICSISREAPAFMPVPSLPDIRTCGRPYWKNHPSIKSPAAAWQSEASPITSACRDMFVDPFPQGCDIHLFSNVLHDWDIDRVEQLLQKSFAALPSGGMVVVHDAHINPT